MKTNRTSEKGQAIVFLVIGLIVFLGFVGLAIDGGRAYSDRRYAQNAADAAALAAAGTIALELENRVVTYGAFDCNSANVIAAEGIGISAAITRAAANEYTITGPTSDWNGVELDCGERDYGYIDKLITVTVRIEDTTETAFAHLLFPNALEIRTEAVAWVRPPMPLVYGNAVVALNPAECSGGSNGSGFDGDVDLTVVGGGIWSNGCLFGNGGPVVSVEPPEAGTHYQYTKQGGIGGTFIPTPETTTITLPPDMWAVPAPDCTGRTFTADEIEDLASPNSGSPTDGLHGLYCLEPGTGDIRVNSSSPKTYFVGYEVTIYVSGNNQDIVLTGGKVVLSPPLSDASGDEGIPGLTIYIDPSATGSDLEITGNNESSLSGTILVPGGTVDIGGTADFAAFESQVIGWNVTLHGNGQGNVVFNENQQYRKPASIELAR